MPIDLAIIKALDKTGKTEDELRGVGATDFIFSPFDNDIYFDELRQVRTMEGTAKLVQSVLRIILTDRGDILEDSQWGSEVNTRIGEKFNTEKFANTRQSIIDALKHYNEINFDNSDSDEVIDTIDELRIVQDLDDPRTMRIIVGFTTESGKGIRVIVPQVEA